MKLPELPWFLYLVLRVRARSLGNRGSGTEWVPASVCASSALSSVFALKARGGLRHPVQREGELMLTRALECGHSELQLSFILGELRSCRG